AFGSTGYAAHRAAVLGYDVHADAAVGAAQFDRAELLEVPRQRGLGDVNAFVGQHRGQFGLAVYRLRGQDRDDASLSTYPGSRGHFSATPLCLSSHTSSAFCACNRFSASSHTALCGPSMTSSVISCPRCAGRQCRTTASGSARAHKPPLSWKGRKGRTRSRPSFSCPIDVQASVTSTSAPSAA